MFVKKTCVPSSPLRSRAELNEDIGRYPKTRTKDYFGKQGDQHLVETRTDPELRGKLP